MRSPTKSASRFFMYARKSTESEDRQVRSIPDQYAEIRELAARENTSVIEELSEARTAKTPGRPVFNAMLDRIERGEADGILAWHPDRLSRNAVDAGRIIWLIDTGKIKALRFPTYSFEPTAQVKFMLSLMLSQSKYYVDNLSENIRRGQRQKIKNGIWPMMAPIGYLNHPTERTIYPDLERAPLIRKAFELHAAGTYTLEQVRDVVNAMGLRTRYGKPLVKSQYHRILRKPIYCGIISYGNELYEGKHEPLISKELFDRVQQVMDGRSRPQLRVTKPYLYQRLFHCGECGCMITNETQKGLHYLRCT